MTESPKALSGTDPGPAATLRNCPAYIRAWIAAENAS
jgi:hypothetical protein